MRLSVICLLSVFLVGCGAFSDPAVRHSDRHYSGFVLDAATRAPVEGLTLRCTSRDVAAGSTLSRRDGSFEIIVPAANPQPRDFLEYGGMLNHITEHGQNIVLIKKIYYQ